MGLDFPLSPWLSLLLPALPLVWRLGWRLAGEAALAPGVAVAAWLLAVHVASLLSGDFALGLTVGTLAAASGGLGRVPRGGQRGPAMRGIAWAAAAGTVVVVPAVLGWDFFDKFPVGTSHFSISAQILNGIYPPRELSFPGRVLVYHYGVDTLFAMTAALTRLPLDWAIDLVTLAAWFYTLILFGLFAARAFGPPAGPIGALVGGFLGRLPLFGGGNLTNQLLGQVHLGATVINPPLTSYFLQHPWTLGLPLALTALCVVQERPRFLPLWLCLGALSVGNTTLFLALTGALLATRERPVLLACAAAAAAAPAVAGMAPMLLGGGAGLVFGAGKGLWWNVLTFGLALPAGLAGMVLLPRLGPTLLLLFAGSFAIVNLLDFQRSWDIAKFGAVAALALALGSAGAVTALWRRTPAAALLLAGLLTLGGFAFHLPFWLHRPDLPADPYTPAARSWPELAVEDDARRAVAWLRTRVGAGEAVLCPPRLVTLCGQAGGLPQFFVHPLYPRAMGVPQTEIDRRLALSPEPQALRAERVRWLVVGRDDADWTARAAVWQAELAARFAEAAVYRLY